MMRKVALISHTDTLTGAPRLLMDMADLLHEAGNHITFIVKNVSGNGLLNVRRNDFTVLELKRYSDKILERVVLKIAQKINHQRFIKILKESDIVINNTIDNAALLPFYKRYAQGKTISYLHELDAVIDTHLPTKELKQDLVAATTHFIVPAQYIKTRVAQKLDIRLDKISVINSKVPNILDLAHPLTREKKEGEFWVGMCGVADFRKGVDIFVQIAERLKNKYKNTSIKLVWLGFKGENSILIEEDIRKLGLESTIYLLPPTLHPDSFYNALDIFALTSREDPYPLVVLNAATAGKPIICFDQSGGSVDFVENSCGFVVPFLDVEMFCEKIWFLFNNQKTIESLGENARKRVAEWHHNDALIINQFNAVFEKISNLNIKKQQKEFVETKIDYPSVLS